MTINLYSFVKILVDFAFKSRPLDMGKLAARPGKHVQQSLGLRTGFRVVSEVSRLAACKWSEGGILLCWDLHGHIHPGLHLTENTGVLQMHPTPWIGPT